MEQYIWPVTISLVFIGMWALVWRALGIAHDLAKTVLGGGTPAPVTSAAVPAKAPSVLSTLFTKAPVPEAAKPAIGIPISPPAAPPAHTEVITPALVAFVKKEEGFSAKAYGDFKQLSIGYGTKATGPDEVITEPEAVARLMTELGHAQAAVEAFVPTAPIGVKQGLTDLSYNAGTAWMKAGLGALVKAGDWAGAAERILQYNHAGGEVNAGLTARRQAEARMFTTPL